MFPGGKGVRSEDPHDPRAKAARVSRLIAAGCYLRRHQMAAASLKDHQACCQFQELARQSMVLLRRVQTFRHPEPAPNSQMTNRRK